MTMTRMTFTLEPEMLQWLDQQAAIVRSEQRGITSKVEIFDRSKLVQGIIAALMESRFDFAECRDRDEVKQKLLRKVRGKKSDRVSN